MKRITPDYPEIYTGGSEYNRIPKRPRMEPSDEEFLKWYLQHARRNDYNPNPWEEKDVYDYHSAYQMGAEPSSSGHWPSEFKGHENTRLYLPGNDPGWSTPISQHSSGLWDTQTGRPAPVFPWELLKENR